MLTLAPGSPETHKIGGQTFGSADALKTVLQAIHSHAMAMAERDGLGECPVRPLPLPLPLPLDPLVPTDVSATVILPLPTLRDTDPHVPTRAEICDGVPVQESDFTRHPAGV